MWFIYYLYRFISIYLLFIIYLFLFINYFVFICDFFLVFNIFLSIYYYQPPTIFNYLLIPYFFDFIKFSLFLSPIFLFQSFQLSLPFSCCLHSIIFQSLISYWTFSFFKFDLCHLSFSFSFCFCLVGVRTVRKSGCSWKVWTYTSYKRTHYSENSNFNLRFYYLHYRIFTKHLHYFWSKPKEMFNLICIIPDYWCYCWNCAELNLI